MTLVLLIGAPAVGKMTVGQELARLSGLKLFHNHVTIEMAAPYFSYGTPQGRRLVGALRQAFFDAFLEADGAGYIFTFVWAFDEPGEREWIEAVARPFAERGHDVHWIELTASLDERLRRNRTANRLAEKPSKRDLDWSEEHLLKADAEHRLVSRPGEIDLPHYHRLDITEMSAADAADWIWTRMRDTGSET